MFNKNAFYFHVISKGNGTTRLFNDHQDKFKILEILIDTCKEYNVLIDAFGVLDTHAHFLLGQELESGNDADALENIKNCLYIINRRYGVYYRNKYKCKNRIFSKETGNIKIIQGQKDYLNTIKYIHLNSCLANIYQTPEDDCFSSYTYFLARYIANEQILKLPAVKNILQNLTFLKIFYSINYNLKQFGPNTRTAMIKFITSHKNYIEEKLLNRPERLRSYRNKLSNSGLINYIENPNLLNISAENHHQKIIALYRLTQDKDLGYSDLKQRFIEQFENNEHQIKPFFNQISELLKQDYINLHVNLAQKFPAYKIRELTGIGYNKIKKIIDDNVATATEKHIKSL